MECGVSSVECGVWSAKIKMQSVKCGDGKCEV